MAFEDNVFINCPFDDEYFSLLRPLIFTVVYLGMKPRIALEALDAGEARLDKIVGLIRESKYSIHDLSRIEARTIGELFRLNMPFELGIDFGCRKFGRGDLKNKRSLVLEAERHRYKAALSDLSGMDIEHHDNSPYKVIEIVRNWLKTTCKLQAAGPARISGAFTDFTAANFDDLRGKGFSREDVDNLPIPELIECMESWVSENR
ncbi:hypothetical protein [Luteibacter yeojuensis]|uniref:Uncharacterized protein n=1 Tax=Luteibacter yeojuensis TaxID=345309 RepID=A0A7X5QTP9_9GAMM|nr:hypothetical protein [Luteibacter yeojuensis]NID15149.1 hypothetical protein [Luteibacter yeojuensis]